MEETQSVLRDTALTPEFSDINTEWHCNAVERDQLDRMTKKTPSILLLLAMLVTAFIKPSSYDLVSTDVHVLKKDMNPRFCVIYITLNVVTYTDPYPLPTIVSVSVPVSAAGIQVDPEKIQAVEEYSVPADIKVIQRFLVMSGRYHWFVPNFTQVAEALNTAERKESQGAMDCTGCL